MPNNVTVTDVLAKLALLVGGAHAELTGRVELDARYSENDPEFIKVLQSINPDKKAQGALLDWPGWTSNRDGDKQDSVFTILRYERFTLDLFYPYFAKPRQSDGKKSRTVFREMVQAIRDAGDKKANADLQLGGAVLNLLFQADADAVIMPFSSGSDSLLLHFLPMTIRVQVIIDACKIT